MEQDLLLQQPASAEKSRVAFLSVVAAVFLTSIKLVVGLLTGSLGILSEALHSGLDLLAAAITLYAVKVADKPADKNHSFGHGKFENFSALIETLLLLITCVWIVYEAVHRLLSGYSSIEVNIWSYLVIGIAILVDVGRSRALYKVAKKHNSQALEADALHFSSDIWSSAVVLVGLGFVQIGWFWADATAAIAVALLVFFVSYRLGKRAIDVLLDRTPPGMEEKIVEILKPMESVKSYHDLRIRASGAEIFIQLNIHVDPEITIAEAHEISEEIKRKIAGIIPRCRVHVHEEPHNKNHE